MSLWSFAMVFGWGVVVGIMFAPRPKPRPCYEISSIQWATVLRGAAGPRGEREPAAGGE